MLVDRHSTDFGGNHGQGLLAIEMTAADDGRLVVWQAAQDHPRLKLYNRPQLVPPPTWISFNYMIRSVNSNAAQLAQIKPPPKAHTPTGTYS
jgi:hypothetical protein